MRVVDSLEQHMPRALEQYVHAVAQLLKLLMGLAQRFLLLLAALCGAAVAAGIDAK